MGVTRPPLGVGGMCAVGAVVLCVLGSFIAAASACRVDNSSAYLAPLYAFIGFLTTVPVNALLIRVPAGWARRSEYGLWIALSVAVTTMLVGIAIIIVVVRMTVFEGSYGRYQASPHYSTTVLSRTAVSAGLLLAANLFITLLAHMVARPIAPVARLDDSGECVAARSLPLGSQVAHSAYGGCSVAVAMLGPSSSSKPASDGCATRKAEIIVKSPLAAVEPFVSSAFSREVLRHRTPPPPPAYPRSMVRADTPLARSIAMARHRGIDDAGGEHMQRRRIVSEGHPFIGLSLTDNIKKGRLVMDGMYESGPAALAGVLIDDELLAVGGVGVDSMETMRNLLMRYCKPGSTTMFTFAAGGAEAYDVHMFVLTAEEEFRDTPFFFDCTVHTTKQSDRLKRTWKPTLAPGQTLMNVADALEKGSDDGQGEQANI